MLLFFVNGRVETTSSALWHHRTKSTRPWLLYDCAKYSVWMIWSRIGYRLRYGWWGMCKYVPFARHQGKRFQFYNTILKIIWYSFNVIALFDTAVFWSRFHGKVISPYACGFVMHIVNALIRPIEIWKLPEWGKSITVIILDYDIVLNGKGRVNAVLEKIDYHCSTRIIRVHES